MKEKNIPMILWEKFHSEYIDDYEFCIEKSSISSFRITQKSKSNGKHYARHLSYTLRQNGHPDINLTLTEGVCRRILEQARTKGPTECFIVEESPDKFNEKSATTVEQILHAKTTKEASFTATGEKLQYHWPIFSKFRSTGFGSIIRATMTLHQLCSSHCQFCSTISRNRSDSISIDEAISFVDSLYHKQEKFNQAEFPNYNNLYREMTGSGIRLKGLILSGGGQPNLWPHFEEFVKYLSTLDLDIGLITNGFPRKVNEEIYNNFKWIRLSITPPEASSFYPAGDFRKQYMPSTLGRNGQTVGLSYVYGPWSNIDDLSVIDRFAVDKGLSYVRVLTDCNLTRPEQLRAHFDLSAKLLQAKLIDQLGRPRSKTFHQLKYHATQDEANEVWKDGQCKLQIYSAFWDTTGHDENGSSYIYPCDSVTVLAESHTRRSERKFNHDRWGTYKNTDVEKLFNQPVRKFFDPRDECSSCLFLRNNKVATQLINSEQVNISNRKPDHINFP